MYIKRSLTFHLVFLVAVASIAYAENGFFVSDGARIHYSVQGEGEPLVFIHGYTNSSDGWNERYIAFGTLVENYRVIALDCRGHGQSGKPYDVDAYGAQMSKDVKNLLDHLGVSKAHVTGYSMGGRITLHFLINYPERCRSAIVAGHGWADPDSGGVGLSEAIADALESGNGITPLIEYLTPEGAPRRTTEELSAANARILANNDARALAAVARGFPRLLVDKRLLKENRVPTLAIAGDADPYSTLTKALANNMPDVELVLLPGADHSTAASHPDLSRHIHAFLAKHTEREK